LQKNIIQCIWNKDNIENEQTLWSELNFNCIDWSHWFLSRTIKSLKLSLFFPSKERPYSNMNLLLYYQIKISFKNIAKRIWREHKELTWKSTYLIFRDFLYLNLFIFPCNMHNFSYKELWFHYVISYCEYFLTIEGIMKGERGKNIGSYTRIFLSEVFEIY
jgi:hypothetical protein